MRELVDAPLPKRSVQLGFNVQFDAFRSLLFYFHVTPVLKVYYDLSILKVHQDFSLKSLSSS